MDETIAGNTGKFGAFIGKWTAYTAFGSFLLYLFGYLTLRFQLSTYGLATNLDVFDEKYLFAGCRFLVFAVTSVPNVLIVVLLFVAIGTLPYNLLSVAVACRVNAYVAAWCARPYRLSLLGVILSVLAIQFFMRRCFAVGNILFAKHLPDEWISSVLLTSPAKLSSYFSGLVAITMLTGGILLWIWPRVTASEPKIIVGLLIFLFAVQVLLLPVNYGVLISTQQLPRVAHIAGDSQQREGASYWLVSDTKDDATYFVRDSRDNRSLLTLPKKEFKLEIAAYDDIFCILFSRNHSEVRPCSSD
ncbi:hypothetical protein [Granulicella arctica]|uniref:hypothetical protein n=1 Tax=Granulicella arctica TaxID=940613 RepID=UPI0021E08AA5|nr:hypothetical protein [Granulicella arctica]